MLIAIAISPYAESKRKSFTRMSSQREKSFILLLGHREDQLPFVGGVKTIISYPQTESTRKSVTISEAIFMYRTLMAGVCMNVLNVGMEVEALVNMGGGVVGPTY
jgi:hypothetical protein